MPLSMLQPAQRQYLLPASLFPYPLRMEQFHAHRANTLGFEACRVEYDGQIVRSKIPYNVDVALEDAEVQSRAVNVKHVTEESGLDDLFHLEL